VTHHGGGIFRWGTVSAGFFALSVAALGATSFVAIPVDLTRIAPVVALRGVSSLALAPLHYLWIALAARVATAPSDGAGLLVLTAVVAAATFSTSNFSAMASESTAALHPPPVVPLSLAATTAAVAATLIGRGAPDPLAATALMAVGQVALCGILALRRPVAARRHRDKMYAPSSEG
jgi:hypothetical protein